MDRKYDVITLGEILLRLSTPINGRLAQGDTLMKHLGGAELNIASEIGQLGLKTAMISKIPNNLLAAFIKNQMNASRVSENYLISDTADDSRIGVYYYEYGSYPRKPRVVYDRKHSSINNIDIKDVPETMFYNTRLPKVIAFNAKDETAKKRYGEIADFMGLGGDSLDEKVDLLIKYLRGMNDDLKIPHCIKNYGADSYPTEQGFVPEEVFLERLPEIAANAILDACTGSNPRQPSQEEMEKLLKCCYYDTEVDF